MIRWAKRAALYLALTCGVFGVISAMNVRDAREAAAGGDCRKPGQVTPMVFDSHKYRHIRDHHHAALKAGWPKVLVLNRRPEGRNGAIGRRARLMRSVQATTPPRARQDRDEYPPAIGRGDGKGLERGRNPTGWRAHVRYVPDRENASHGASLGGQLRGLCEGSRFRYVFVSNGPR